MEDSSDGLLTEEAMRLSKFNGAFSQLNRLDELWQDAHKHARHGQLDEYNWDLDRVWCELAGDFDEKDEKNKVFAQFNSDIESTKSEYIKDPNNKLRYIRKLYKILNEKELFLRRLQNKLGKGTSYIEGDEDYMEG